MTISCDEEWVQIAALDAQGRIRFTAKFQALNQSL